VTGILEIFPNQLKYPPVHYNSRTDDDDFQRRRLKRDGKKDRPTHAHAHRRGVERNIITYRNELVIVTQTVCTVIIIYCRMQWRVYPN